MAELAADNDLAVKKEGVPKYQRDTFFHLWRFAYKWKPTFSFSACELPAPLPLRRRPPPLATEPKRWR